VELIQIDVVRLQPAEALLERPVQAQRPVALEGVGKRDLGLDPPETVAIETDPAEKGDARARGWTAEQTSWTKPGRVSSAERVPPALFKKYFEPAGEKKFRVVERVRSRVTFHRHDLLTLKPVGEGYNLIVCKNVLLHFQAADRVEVCRMFHNALAPDGLLATEQTQKLPAEVAHLFHQVVSDGQVFKRVERARASAA